MISNKSGKGRTQNEFNRLNIDLENVLTPLEIANIARLADLPESSVVWLENIEELCPELIHEPKRFERRQLSDGITAYESSDLELAERDLLVAFCGNAERLMLPVSGEPRDTPEYVLPPPRHTAP